jgi:glycine/D-amino acid oxidase-like deaminating enzyme
MASRKGLYVCVTHSGITLAPALGMLGTQELLDGIRDNLLLPFGPDRFATT